MKSRTLIRKNEQQTIVTPPRASIKPALEGKPEPSKQGPVAAPAKRASPLNIERAG